MAFVVFESLLWLSLYVDGKFIAFMSRSGTGRNRNEEIRS